MGRFWGLKNQHDQTKLCFADYASKLMPPSCITFRQMSYWTKKLCMRKENCRYIHKASSSNFVLLIPWETVNAVVPLSGTVPTFNSCTKCVGSRGLIHDRTPNCQPGSWAWMNEWTWFASCAGHWWSYLIVDILAMGVCTARHCQTCGRVVQELNVCTVDKVPCTIVRENARSMYAAFA